MTDGEKLESWFIQEHGELKTVETITSLIAKGKTLIYGASGSGKTYSTIKHLNNHGIKPLMLDFDNNSKVDDLNFSLIGGVEFLKGFYKKLEEKVTVNEELEKKRNDLIAKEFIEYKKKLFPDNPHKKMNIANKDAVKQMGRRNEKFFFDLMDIEDEIEKSKVIKREVNMFHVKGEVIMIDTCAKAVTHFEDYIGLDRFVNKLLALGNDVILIAHTKRYMNDEVPDIDEIISNHCDCRLQLTRSITKTKGAEVALTVRKLRGYKGEPIIKDWER